MRTISLIVTLVAFLTLVSAGARADRGSVAQPTAAAIETLIRKSLAESLPPIANLSAYRGAELTAFELLGLDRLSPDSWQARLAMRFDFGEPAGVVRGYQRVRKGHYRVVLKPREGQWTLDRFTPLGKFERLPRSG